MNSHFLRAASIVMCLALILTAFTACKKGSKSEEGVTVSGDAWSQGVPASRVDLTDEEIIDLVKEALGDKMPADFNGDLTTLSSDDIALVRAKAEALGYYFTKNADGTFTVQKSVSLVNVSDGSVVALVEDALGEDAAKDFDGDLASLDEKELEKVKEYAEDKDVYIVTDENGKPEAKVDASKSSDSANKKYRDTPTTTTTVIDVVNGTTAKTDKNNNKDKGGSGNSGSGSGGNSGGSGESGGFTTESTTSSIDGRQIVTAITADWLEGFENSTSSLSAVKATGDGGMVAAGSSTSGTSTTASIAKFNSNGKKQWDDSIKGSENVGFQDVAVLSDGSVIAVGYTFDTDISEIKADYMNPQTSSEKGMGDFLIVKYSSKGKQEWSRVFGGTQGDLIYCVAACPGGGFVIGGIAKSTDGDFSGIPKISSNGQSAAVAIKFADNDASSISWIKQMTSSKYACVEGVAVADNGDVFTTTDVKSPDFDFASIPNSDIGGEKTLVVKYNSSGAYQWQQTICSSARAYMPSVTADNEGGCVVAGYYSSASPTNENNLGCLGTFSQVYNGGNAGSADGAVVALGSGGAVKWLSVLTGFYADFVTDIVPVATGYVVVGYSNSTNRDFSTMPGAGDYDVFVCAMSHYGTNQKMLTFGGSDADKILGACALGDDTVGFCGSTSSGDQGFGSMSPSGSSTSAASFVSKATLTY
ncbi:MAG: hypothetical protein IJK60_11755 [Clostridia bacterium]|nr:hypothetical protein [Clostridia bacterium]